MKKVLSLIIAFAILVGTFSFVYAQDNSISTVDDLIALANAVKSSEDGLSGENYVLLNDIDLEGMVWTDFIGTEAQSFNGIFDGNGHIIYNYKLNVKQTGFGSYIGLFGIVGGDGLVKNIGVSDITVAPENEWGFNAVVGGLVGVIKDNGKVANAFAKNVEFTAGTYNVHTGGGLVGELNGDGAMVVNCYSVNCTEENVTVVANLSGLIGIAQSFYAVENCWADDTLTMVNHKDLSKVKNSYYFVNDDGTGYLRAGELVKAISASMLGEEYVDGDSYPVQKWETGLPPVDIAPGVPEEDDENTRPAPPVIKETVEIATAEALMAVSTSPMSGVEYKLVADIDLGGIDWNNYVIANPDAPFKGIFDGNNHIISNFKINLPAGDYKEESDNELDLGLFGTLGGTGIIKNLGIENVTFYSSATSGYNARGGGLVAKVIDYGTVENCYARNVIFNTKKLNNRGQKVGPQFGEAGGLVGYVNGKGVNITNCYITGVEEINDCIANDGGLIGPMKSFEKVENCYSTTTLTQCTINNAEKVINSYCMNNSIWATLGHRPGTLVAEEGLKNADMGDMYKVDTYGINQGYPVLLWENSTTPIGGPGSINNPHLIKTVDELKTVAEYGSASGLYFRLENDIDLGGATWKTYIGDVNAPFKGVFDGNGHVISNYKLILAEAPRGLFGAVGGSGIVRNLGVNNVTFEHDTYRLEAGGIVGRLMDNGTVTNCFAKNMTSTRTGTNTQEAYAVGGIIGKIDGAGATFTNCYALNCEFASTKVDHDGGLAGVVTNFKTISNLYTNNHTMRFSLTSDAGVSNVFCTTPTNWPQNWNGSNTGYIGNVLSDTGLKNIASSLGKSFVNDNGTNSGYPILLWETGVAISIDNIELLKADESVATTVAAATKVGKVSVTVIPEKNIDLIVALYNGDKLISLKQKSVKYSNQYDFDMDATDADCLKVFMFEKGTITPVIENAIY